MFSFQTTNPPVIANGPLFVPTSVKLVSGVQFQFLLTSDPGQRVLLQTSTSLMDWRTFATNKSGASQYFEVLNKAAESKFYRAILVK